MHVGDKVRITVSPDHGDHEGTIKAIGQVPPSGDYPTITVDVPAYGTFTRPSDEVLVPVTVMIHTYMWACDDFQENAADMARYAKRDFGLEVADWELVQEGTADKQYVSAFMRHATRGQS